MEYCRCRNQIRRLTRHAVKSKENNIANQVKSNSKQLWRYINTKTKPRPTIPELYTTNVTDPSKMTNNDSEKAEVLGKFFSSVNTIEPEWTWVLNDEDKPNISKVINIEITQELIQKKLCKLNVNKSPGPDNLHPRGVKELADVLVKPFHIIFNLSLRFGKIPTAWKTATVSAIYKLKGSKNVAENYRPVSMTSIMSRIMKSNSILSDKQFGFMGQKSTILQLLKIVDEWTKILDSGGFIDVVYCDFQKAFDTVPHNRLLDPLTHYGINEPIFSWISDFLSNRKQQVSINGCLSSTFCVTSGVPQGSVFWTPSIHNIHKLPRRESNHRQQVSLC